MKKTLQKLERELFWKPRFAFWRELYRTTGYDGLSFSALDALNDKHKGETCLILGNGPSLAQLDFETAKTLPTLASNKIFLIFDKTDWRPTYFFVEDDLVISQNIDHLSRKIDPATTSITPYVCKVYDTRLYGDVYVGYSFRKIFDRAQHFSTDPMREIYNGYSVVYTQIQMALYMGFETLLLAGVDFRFDTGKETAANGELLGGGTVNHFSKNYRKPGERWNLPHLERQKISFSMARHAANVRGVRILNCTPGTALEVFELGDLADHLPAASASPVAS